MNVYCVTTVEDMVVTDLRKDAARALARIGRPAERALPYLGTSSAARKTNGVDRLTSAIGEIERAVRT